MKWTAHPAKENQPKTVLSLLFIIAFLVVVCIFYGIYWTLLGFVILFVSLHSYYFPTHYEITNDEVIIKNIFVTQHRKLKEFKKVYRGKNGILLSPFKHRTMLNRFRGVFLLLPEDSNGIVEHLKEKIEYRDTGENISKREKSDG